MTASQEKVQKWLYKHGEWAGANYENIHECLRAANTECKTALSQEAFREIYSGDVGIKYDGTHPKITKAAEKRREFKWQDAAAWFRGNADAVERHLRSFIAIARAMKRDGVSMANTYMAKELCFSNRLKHAGWTKKDEEEARNWKPW